MVVNRAKVRECCKSVANCYRVLQGVTECCRVLPSVARASYHKDNHVEKEESHVNDAVDHHVKVETDDEEHGPAEDYPIFGKHAVEELTQLLHRLTVLPIHPITTDHPLP